MPIFEYDRSRAMKQTDFTPCARCGKGVMHTGLPMFYRVTVEHMGIDVQAARRQMGLEMMLGGAGRIANVMGPDEDMGLPIGSANQGLFCETCANDLNFSFAEAVEALGRKDEDKDEDAA
jgi:hypothetical protein